MLGHDTATQGNWIGAYPNPMIIEIGTVDFSGSDSQAPVPAASTFTALAIGPTSKMYMVRITP